VVLCVFGPDHVPLSIVENGTTDALAFLPSAQGFVCAPICSAASQWQPVQVTLSPLFKVDAAGLHGKLDADGAILLSTNATSGNGVVSCLSSNFAHRWSVELLATGWNVLATSSAAVLLGNSTAVPGFQGLVLLDRGNGAALRSHFYAAAASSLVQAQFANDGLRFVLAAQSVSTRFVYAPSASEPLRAFEVSTLTPIPARTLSHDAATDLFTLPLVDGRTVFATAAALGTAANAPTCLPTVTLGVLPVTGNPLAMTVQATNLPSLPKLPRAASEPASLPLTSTPVPLELRSTEVLVQPLCR
jgi:hypothetical protein